MVEVQKPEIVKQIQDDTHISPAVAVPTALRGDIQPVLKVNPMKSCNICRSATRSSTGQGVVYTTPEDKDFYLVSAQLSAYADVLATNTEIYLSIITDEGATTKILTFTKPSLTALMDCKTVSFPIPIKLKRGTYVSIYSLFGAGSCSFTGSIQGFTLEPLKK